MKWHILLVDPDQRAAEVESVLSDEGYRVSWVRSGEAALADIQGEQPDLVISELQLPDIKWSDFVERLEEEIGTERLRLLVMTKSTEVERDPEVTSSKRANWIFQKPFRIDEFIKRVQQETDAITTASTAQ